jgi:sugar lactone lactonase YvrE
MSPFLAGGADGRTTAIGMKVDRQGRLFVAGGGTGAVWVYDTKTRTLIRKFESGFSGQQFLNDLVIAPNGDVFVTDSMRRSSTGSPPTKYTRGLQVNSRYGRSSPERRSSTRRDST